MGLVEMLRRSLVRKVSKLGDLLGSGAVGDLYYRNSTGALTKLPAGGAGQVLKSNGSTPFWGLFDAPVVSAATASAVTTTTATLNFTSNEVGNYYYLVLLSTVPEPSAATIKAQGTAPAKGTAASIVGAHTPSVTGLTANTAYKAYVIVEDGSSNTSNTAVVNINTAA